MPKGSILALALLLLLRRRCSDGAVKKVVKALPDRRGGVCLEMSIYEEEDDEDSELLEPRRSRRGYAEYADSAARDALGAAGLL